MNTRNAPRPTYRGAPQELRRVQDREPIVRQDARDSPGLAELVATASEQAAAVDAAFREGYRLGFPAGWEVGRMQLDRELTEQDRLRMARMHDLGTTPTYIELERRRWDGKREDFGQPRAGDFAGAGADYQPPSYYVPQLPGGASRHRVQRGAA